MGLSRRDILIGAPGVAAGYLTAKVLADTRGPTDRRGFRIAHLTDVHILPKRGPEKSFAEALEHAQGRGAELIINGGDAIMDASDTKMSLVETYWSAYNRILKEHNSLPVINVLGNHDVFGWSSRDRRVEFKAEALQRLGLEKPYYSLEKAGWKLIVLDSIAWAPERPRGYKADLGLDQQQWLTAELESTKLPTCVISHIPILSACAFFDGPNEETDDWTVPGAWMHLDARALNDLFSKHPQVKLCLSGHIHLVDSVRFVRVEYFCDGAVSGYYWKGPYQGFGPGYALVDLLPDGSYRHEMVYY